MRSSVPLRTVFPVLRCLLAHRSFLDYLAGGCEINLIAAIDFTLSNKA